MERVQLHCNFSFNYYLNDSMHLIVQDQSETMDLWQLQIKGLLYDFCNGIIFLHYVLDNNSLTKSDD